MKTYNSKQELHKDLADVFNGCGFGDRHDEIHDCHKSMLKSFVALKEVNSDTVEAQNALIADLVAIESVLKVDTAPKFAKDGNRIGRDQRLVRFKHDKGCRLSSVIEKLSSTIKSYE